jgi:hypothetical protein
LQGKEYNQHPAEDRYLVSIGGQGRQLQ